MSSFLKTLINTFIRKQQLWALSFLSDHHHYHGIEHEGKFMTRCDHSDTLSPNNTRMTACKKGCNHIQRSHFPVKPPLKQTLILLSDWAPYLPVAPQLIQQCEIPKEIRAVQSSWPVALHLHHPADYLTDWVGGWMTDYSELEAAGLKATPPPTSWRAAWLKRWMDGSPIKRLCLAALLVDWK